jgi:peroxiredoxin
MQQQLFGQENALTKAREIVRNASGICYLQESIYPNPMGSNDTLRSTNEFDLVNHNFKFVSPQYEEFYINNNLKVIDHAEKKVKFFSTENESESFKSNNRNLIFSTVELLNLNWILQDEAKETTNEYSIFRNINTDTIVNGNSIKTDFFIFINRKTNLIDKFERRNYFKGELSQTIQVVYREQKLTVENILLSFVLPEEYYSEPYFNRDRKIALEVGNQAILFNGKTLSGEIVALNQFKGKRVLLVFSTINCGYCQMAAEQFSSSSYKAKNNVSIIYLKPLDSKESIQHFTNNFSFKFPILAESKNIGELYGISGYPTFIELNEDLIIEVIKLGYSKDFINKYNQNY